MDPVSPSNASVHVPVLVDETLDGLQIEQDSVIVDGTFGGGGHSRRILEQLGESGLLIAMDRDPNAIDRFGGTVKLAHANLVLINDSYHRLGTRLQATEHRTVDGILLDLGLSSDQLGDAERGFSYHADGPLDLRFNPDEGESASELLMRLPEKEIADLIYQFGEERKSRRIAARIVEQRKKRKPVRTAGELAELVRRCVPRSKNHRIDPATRTFQALRIAVNQELKIVQQAMIDLPAYLNVGGRFVVITFHSLEDRIVKHAMRQHELLKVITKKPITAEESEIQGNPRARSAKLRIAERVAEAGYDASKQWPGMKHGQLD